ncbi:hypothetical protein [Streptomyces sp. NPDC097640]|uniref:hypothetical protein n=1 Tax=Streptomyces sp. NPDC097640 TaxID=3157229 RepID=UPI00333332F4
MPTQRRTALLGWGAEYAALAELGQGLQPAGPVQRRHLDLGLGRADTVDRARAGLRDDGARGAGRGPAADARRG